MNRKDGVWNLEEKKDTQEEDLIDEKNGLMRKIINEET